MISHLVTRLNRLERSHGLNVICTTCQDAGLWVAHYENDTQSKIRVCPECGRCNIINVCYVAPPLPTNDLLT